jgi:hypothetical protein
MIFHFTCACGNSAKIQTESLALAESVLKDSRWMLKFGETPICSKCREDKNDPIVAEVAP